MKNLNKAILIALGMSLPLSAMASPGEDVTIRMMEANEHAPEAVTSHIELPEAADDHAKEHAAKGMDTANNNRGGDHGDMERDRDRDMDGEDRDHERDMDREEDHEREMDRDDRKDVEHGGIDREEIEHEGFEDQDHGSMGSEPEFEAPDQSGPETSHGGPK